MLAVFPANATIDLPAASTALGGVATPGEIDELPDPFRRATGPVPPLGQLFGMPIVLDDRLARAPSLVFRAFAESAYFEIAYDDFARLEQPRIARLAAEEPAARASSAA